MLITRLHVLAAALTGCAVAASAYVFRKRARQQNAQRLSHQLSTWEGEGGNPGAPEAAPADSH